MNIKAHKIQWLHMMEALIVAVTIICLPIIVVGADGPETIVLDQIQQKYGAVNFNHSMHSGLAESCGKCHHQHNDKLRAECKECHTMDSGAYRSSVKQGFLPCSGCHTEYSPETPGMPGLKVALHKTCFQCHVGMGQLGSSPKGCTEICHGRK
ncbi:MAG TPA: cytochrome c3 family protein [Dissulfurispiraceae bacterium]|nr:cytochrome c3 family protein [Dissulfurispiraceae bacterium]